MCKRFVFCWALLYWVLPTLPATPYFQQQADFQIHATLDVTDHRLTVEATLFYTNNAPDTLRQLAFHLWMNAYSSGQTALAEQENYQGNPVQYFKKPLERGGYDAIRFEENGQTLNTTYNTDQPEIVYITLSTPLPPGGKTEINIPYELQLPTLHSRAGYLDDYYLLAQWYPKPAVYDRDGWHTFPYLENGEYYAEFGTYEVSLTLPGDYVVAATGMLQTTTELSWLNQIAGFTSDYEGSWSEHQDKRPTTPSNTKTIRYTAENVHDFTWVASPDFLVKKDSIILNKGQQVTTWAFFYEEVWEEWADISTYTKNALQLFSDLVGSYPYPQYSCVHNPGGYGGGMEYAMLTVLDHLYTPKYLEMVTAHEVAHSWYQQVLGINERDYAWMDEGLTSYLEYRYGQQYHSSPADCWCDIEGRNELVGESFSSYLKLAKQGLLAPGAGKVAQMRQNEYGTMAYNMSFLGFRLLAHYYGEDRWDELMRGFFKKWTFKHPGPSDLQNYLEQQTGDQLNWFFEDYIGRAAIVDYDLSKIKNGQITIRNRGQVAAPFELVGYSIGDEEQFRQWVSGFSGEKTITMPEAGNTAYVVIDPDLYLPDARRTNNRRRSSLLAAKNIWPRFSMRPAESFDDWRAVTYVLPSIIGNAYDGLTPGLVFSSGLEQQQRFEYMGFLGYALKSKSPAGGLTTRYHLWQGDRAARFSIGLGGKQFHFNERDQFDYQLQFRRLVPSLQYQFKRPLGSSIRQDLQLRLIWLSQETARFSDTGDYLGKAFNDSWIPHLRYRLKNDRGIHPFQLEASLEYQSYDDLSGRNQSYLRSSLEFIQDWTYAPDRRVQLRFFAGGMLNNTARNRGRLFPGHFSLVSRGQNDYRFDGSFLGRNVSGGVFANQIMVREGGFKAPLSSGFQVGRSNNFILASNIKAQLPGRLPFQLFLDMGYYDNATPIGQGASFADQFLWSGGVALELWDGILGVYIPLVQDDDITSILSERGNFFERISFQIDLMRLSPWRYRDFGERLD